MALSERERLILSVIEAWRRDHPNEYGPDLVAIDEDVRVLCEVLGQEYKPIGGLVLGMRNKGLLETQLNETDWRWPQRWRVTSLLERLAHESSE